MRVALAEDGALFREGLVLLLKAAGHDVVGCLPDGDQLIELLATVQVEVAILDIRMPPEPDGGLVTARRLRALYPELGLLLLSHHAEVHYLTRLLEIGTHRIGYRLKDKIANVQVLGGTLERIAAGEIVIEPAVAGRLVGRPSAGAQDQLSTLSARELQVLQLMAEGRSNNSIADELFVGVKAVEKYVTSIFVKLDLPADAVAHHRRVLAVLAYLRTRRIES